jgi:hypothetical protein
VTVNLNTKFQYEPSRRNFPRLSDAAPNSSIVQENLHSIRGPSSDAASEEVRILGPDWTPETKCGRQNRPIFRITSAQPLPRLRLIVTERIRRNYVGKSDNGPQHGNRFCRVASPLGDECRQMFFRFRIS